MLKLLGAACVLWATVGGFAQLRRALLLRVAELQSWLAAVRLLQSEMNYGLLPLPRICEQAAAHLAGQPAGSFWQELAAALQQGRPQALPEIWRQLLEQQRGGWHLLAEDWQALQELGQGLGSSGLSNQQRLLALCEQRLEARQAEAEAASQRLSRLLSGLGWCSGLLLICLWL